MSFLKKIFGKDKPILNERDELRRIGLDILRNETLYARILLLEEAVDTINNKSLPVEERINKLDRVLRLVALPWGRGGDRPIFLKMMVYWENILKVWRDMLAYKEEVEKSEGVNREYIDKVARLVDLFGQREVIPYGLIILDAAWLSEDVAPQYAAILQNVMMPTGGWIMPTAAGVESKPKPPPQPAPPFVGRRAGESE